MARKIEIIKMSQRKLLGKDLDPCSSEELQEISRQLEISLNKIRARKDWLFKEQIEQLQAKERLLLEENARLRKQVISKCQYPGLMEVHIPAPISFTP
ncbi:hypothetical protein OIU77_007252 [Salix suchowensis]|uniref:K-box domain-containing protein n=1 Tax=Salix suchowensis TaxID=1278906 RepID=A0ABQ9AFF7_9ROSI|nr:hypothetical protein OIU77_007252 [Salix suchowensis]